MYQHNVRQLCIVFAAAAALALASDANAQVMSFSFYGDATTNSSEDTFFTIVDGYDNSSGCDHSGYDTYATLSTPGDWMEDYFGGLSAEFGVPVVEGEYAMTTSSTFWCSCINSPQNAGGGYIQPKIEGYIARYERTTSTTDCTLGLRRYEEYSCSHVCQEAYKCFPPTYDFFEVIGSYVTLWPGRSYCTPGVPFGVNKPKIPICKAPGEP